MRFQVRVPRFRLVDGYGYCHGEMDALYESFDEAWSDGLQWWQGQGGDPALPCGLGVEVSTLKGHWRTLRQPDCAEIRGSSCALPRL